MPAVYFEITYSFQSIISDRKHIDWKSKTSFSNQYLVNKGRHNPLTEDNDIISVVEILGNVGTKCFSNGNFLMSTAP